MKRLFSRVAVVVAMSMASVLVVPVGVAGAVASGPVNHDQAFVTAAYNDFLGRDPLPGELASATAVSLASQGARATVVTKLSKSPEWIRVTVDQMYVDTLGRPGDQGGVDYWVGLISTGRMSVAQVAASLYSSPEYFVGFGGSDVRTWVLDLYTKVLHRPGADDPSGVNYWVATAVSRGRHAVAFAFYQSGESCRTRVANLYETLLGRSPDQGGWTYWAQQVKTQGDLALAANLAASAEYYGHAFDRYGREVPGVPTGVRALAGDGQSVVSWVAAETTEAAPVTAYKVTASPGNETCTTTGDLACTVMGLTNGTSYSYRVTATNAVGDSTPSAAVAADQWHELYQPQNPWTPRGMTDGGVAFGSAANGQGAVCENYCIIASVLASSDQYPNVEVTGMSSAGVIVGFDTATNVQRAGWNAMHRDDSHALVWSSSDATTTVLDAPSSYVEVKAWGVSTAGVIVGGGVDANNHSHALVWNSSNVSAAELQVPTGFTSSAAAAVSPDGVIVGSGEDAQGSHALEWASASATPSILTAPTGLTSAFATGISSTGVVIGHGTDANGGNQVVVWTSPLAPGAELEAPGGATSVTATAVSPSGEIVGFASNANDNGQALIWSSSTAAPTPLVVPAGYTSVQATGVSSSGRIVGSGIDPDGNRQSLAWANDLTTPAGTRAEFQFDSYEAIDKSSNGSVVGFDATNDNHRDAFVWPSANTLPTMLAPGRNSHIQPVGVSSTGVVIGNGVNTGGGDVGLAWTSRTADPIVVAPPSPYGDNVHVQLNGISPDGVIVGTLIGADANQHGGWVWSSPSAMPTALAAPVGFTKVGASAISPTGIILGSGYDSSSTLHGLMWASPSATPTVLHPGGEPTAVSSVGVIAGHTYDTTDHVVNMAWTSSTADPVTLDAGGLGIDWNNTGASSAGVIASSVHTPDFKNLGVVWSSATAEPTVLTPPNLWSEVEIWSITADGTIVGSVWSPQGTPSAAVLGP